MRMKTLGNSDLAVAPLAFGGNVFGWTVDAQQAFRILDAFVDLGFNLLDTANIYSVWVPGNAGGESETVIGQWLKATGKRDTVIIATKVGMQMGDGSKGLRKEYILQSVEASLKRLQTDVIDLYQSHRDDEHTPMEETLAAYDALIRDGKVRYIGASNFNAQRLQQSLRLGEQKQFPTYVCLQPEYNLYARSTFETELEPICLQNNLGVISYFSLASGFLSGKYRTDADLHKSVRGGGIARKYFNERGFRILAALDVVSKSHNTVPAVVALAWLMHRPSITAPIVSATTVDQMLELAKAVELELSDSDLTIVDEASAVKIPNPCITP